MKKLIALFAVFAILALGINNVTIAQNDKKAAEEPATEQVTEAQEAAPAAAEQAHIVKAEDQNTSVEKSLHYVLKDKFAEGDPLWMTPVLICLVLGLAFAIERIFYLNLASTNSQKLLAKVEEAMKNGGVEKAKDVCRDTKGPLAGVFYQGLDRYEEGLDSVEKSLVAYGGVEMGRLEKNLSWLSLCMALATQLGFMGTVIGMVAAFDNIERQGDISPTVVAGGMKVALLTTVFGLITAVILQIFYNYILSKIDGIVNDMENATIGFMDIMVNYNKK